MMRKSLKRDVFAAEDRTEERQAPSSNLALSRTQTLPVHYSIALVDV